MNEVLVNVVDAFEHYEIANAKKFSDAKNHSSA